MPRLPSSQTDTKTQILDLAENLLQLRGYVGFSYNDISTALEVKNAAIHYHYPSKNDLGLALVQRYRDRFRRWFAEQHQPDATPRDKLEWYLAMTCKYVDQGFKICPAGILEADFNVLPADMQAETQALVREALEWFSAVLEEGLACGDFRFSGPPRDKAIVILAALQGALQMARALGAEVFQAALGQLRRELGYGEGLGGGVNS